MKKSILLIVVALLANSGMLAAGEPWSKSIDLGLNLTQNSYSDSWRGEKRATCRGYPLCRRVTASDGFNFGIALPRSSSET